MIDFLLPLFYLSLGLILWVVIYQKASAVFLLFPVAFDSYLSFIYPGLMTKDVALIFWLCAIILFCKKLGVLTLISASLLIWLVVLNLLRILNGDSQTSVANSIMTPFHMYFPYLILIFLLENRIKGIEVIWLKFDKIIFPLTLVLMLTILVSSNFIENIKTLPGVSSSAGFFSVIYALWLAVCGQHKSRLIILTVTLFLFLFLALSQTRGAILVFVALTFAVLLLIRKNKYAIQRIFTVLGLGIFLSTAIGIFFFAPALIPDSFMSIFSLYQSLMVSQVELVSGNELNMDSGDIRRFTIWAYSFDVWMDNFLLGIGISQFDSSSLFEDLDQRISPHHSVLSVAIDGGIIAVCLYFWPQMYLVFKTIDGKSMDERIVFHFSWIHIVMSFVFGYSFNFILVVAFYLRWLSLKRNDLKEGYQAAG